MVRREQDRHIGARLRAAREAKGWSQRRLARKLGVSNQAVSNWESAVHMPQAKHVLRAEYALDAKLREEEE